MLIKIENPSFYKQQEDKIIERKKGAALILSTLDSVICNNPDITKHEILELVESRAKEYDLLNKQVDSLKNGIDTYFRRNQAIKKDLERFREKFKETWKKEFFKYCFGKYPIGEIDIRQGNTAIYFQCQSLSDYAVACDIPEDEASKSFGHRKSPLDEQPRELEGVIINEYSGHPMNKKKNSNEQKEKSLITEKHEEQHVIFDMLDDELDLSPLNFDDLSERSSLMEIQKAVSRYLRLRREEMERMAKNEIIAYWRDGENEPDKIKNIILETGGLYDNKDSESEESLGRYLISRFSNNYKIFIPKLNINNIWYEECLKFDEHIEEAVRVLKEIELSAPERKIDYVYLLSLEKLDKWSRIYRLINSKF